MFERANDFGHRLESLAGMLRHHALDDARKLFRHAVSNFFGRDEVLIRMRRHQLDGGVALERRLPGDHDIERATERINIGTMIDTRRIATLFRRHVRRRSERDSHAGHVRWQTV